MLMLLIALLLAALVLMAITLQKAYTHIPYKELKRRARGGDDFANILYRAAAYGPSVEILLWGILGLGAAGFFVVVAKSVPAWLALLISLVLVWLGFAWLPKTKLSSISKLSVRYLTGPFTWLLRNLYPVLSRIADRTYKYVSGRSHTGLYQRDDLVGLLKAQKEQPDNRISPDELRIAEGALTFGDKIVRDCLTPRRAVKSVATTDDIGPHLMDELHASGHSRFPVYQDKPDNIVGMLYVRDLMSTHTGGHVRDLMKREVFYVHDEQTLRQVLSAFLKTKHHLFIVVNSFEEIIGIITIEDVLEQILGKPIVDEFDKYDDMRAVAALAAKNEHQEKVPEVGKEASPDKP